MDKLIYLMIISFVRSQLFEFFSHCNLDSNLDDDKPLTGSTRILSAHVCRSSLDLTLPGLEVPSCSIPGPDMLPGAKGDFLNSSSVAPGRRSSIAAVLM